MKIERSLRGKKRKKILLSIIFIFFFSLICVNIADAGITVNNVVARNATTHKIIQWSGTKIGINVTANITATNPDTRVTVSCNVTKNGNQLILSHTFMKTLTSGVTTTVLCNNRTINQNNSLIPKNYVISFRANSSTVTNQNTGVFTIKRDYDGRLMHSVSAGPYNCGNTINVTTTVNNTGNDNFTGTLKIKLYNSTTNAFLQNLSTTTILIPKDTQNSTTTHITENSRCNTPKNLTITASWNLSDFVNGPVFFNKSDSYTLSSWNYFYGALSGSLVLGNSAGKSIMNWSGYYSANIYVVPQNAAINWASSTAVGKRKTSGNSNKDFSELNTKLSLNNLTDSLNATFSPNGNGPRFFRTFTVFGKSLSNVPIYNSTNSSTFTTGILWDSSDDTGDNEYDKTDNEDVIFISQVNKNKQGKYGTYDYELRIPASFDSYKGGNSVDFYLELY